MMVRDQQLTGGNDIFGLAYWNTSICLFGKNIIENSGGADQISRTVLLSTLLQHEFGHLLGLVAQGSPPQSDHRDSAHGAHCTTGNCLMNYGIETISSTGSANNFIPSLDISCTADLKANGGR